MHAAAPLLNRATQGLFIPGSTFKVVTAAAALDTGRYTPESRFDDPGYCIEYGQRVSNFADQGGPEVFGNVDFSDGAAELDQLGLLQHRQGARAGSRSSSYAERFGFYEEPPLETPASERSPSGLYHAAGSICPEDPNDVDPGRLAFGQERLLVDAAADGDGGGRRRERRAS